MAQKLVALKNFHASDMAPLPKNAKEDAKQRHREWLQGEEYTGEDDTDRLQEEGCIGPAPVAKGKKAGKKTANDLEEGEAISTDGEEAEETVPADGSDGEEAAPVKPAKVKKKRS